MGNNSKNVRRIEADFGDGVGFRTINPEVPVDVNYPSGGEKIITVRVFNPNGTAQSSITSVNVSIASDQWGLYSVSPEQRNNPIYADIPFNGFQGLGWVTYLYRNSDKKLRKPVLVVDGFDPGNKRSDDILFFDYLNKNNSIKFADMLYLCGYDLVILDFPKAENQNTLCNNFEPGYGPPNPEAYYCIVDAGADYIQRNAYVAIKVIEELKLQLQQAGSTEKLVVVGPSMGGLISRYALAYMEKNGLNHNTRLWVSFDSPHNGANIPIGVQYFVNYFASISSGAEEARDEKLNSNAARQMLIHHYKSNSETPSGDPSFRPSWENALAEVGFPQQLRRIALLNGSLGSTQTYTPSSRAVTMDIKTFFGTTTIGWGYINTTGGYGNRSLVFKGIKPTSGSTTSKYAYGLTGSYSLDNSPGGTTDAFAQMQQSGSWYYRLQWNIPIPYHSFIPTKSALAFSGSNKDLAENLSGRNLVATGETPFQSYWGPKSYNMGHITFDPNMAIWLMGELNGLPQQPMAGSYQVVGPDAICTQTTANYSISDIPQLLSISWSCSGNLIFESTQGSCCSVRPSSSPSSDKGWVQATISLGNMAIGSYRKEVTVGAPSLPTICGIGEMACGGTELFTECEHLSVQWSATYPLSITGGSYGFKCNVRAGNESGIGWVYATASNACGTKRAEMLVEVSCGFYAIYPNPVYSEMTIKTVEASNAIFIKEPPEPIKTVRIFDKMGFPVLTRNFSGKDKSVTVNISLLPNGVYLVKINETESHTIIKE
jgi:hypothetical protein